MVAELPEKQRMSSYRTRRRRVNEEANTLLQELNNSIRHIGVGETTINRNYVVNVQGIQCPPQSISVDRRVVTVENINVLSSKVTIDHEIRDWAIKHNVTHSALSDLLKIIKPHFLDSSSLPICSKTLLKTPRNICIQTLAGGKFFYFGIKSQILKIIPADFPFSELTLTIGTDGFPICKSSGTDMWPILFKINEISNSRPIIAGLFCGDRKPSSLDEFLNQFITELTELETSGILMRTTNFSVRVKCIIADAPARSFIKGIKPHNGRSSCERCDVEGEWDGKRIVFPTFSGSKRTDLSFRSQIDSDHHLRDSPFLKTKIDLVSEVVLDYMHLVCLGVTRKLLLLWLSGPIKTRLPTAKVKIISENFSKIAKIFPCEFSRKPRDLKDIKRFKATEFRQFLLYVGPAALRNILPSNLYNHFLIFHTAIYILLSSSANNINWNNTARELIELFVKDLQRYYGGSVIVYNVHSLLHLSDDALKFGKLDNVSAFEFESYLQFLKKLIRGNNRQLEQVVKRVQEYDNCSSSHYSTIKSKHKINVPKKNGEFKKFELDKFCIRIKDGDNHFVTEDGRFVKVDKIFVVDNKPVVNCKVYLNCTDVKGYPIRSSLLGICFLNSQFTSSCEIDIYKLSKKCIVIPGDSVDKFMLYCIPML